jgi:hypothetical protein
MKTLVFVSVVFCALILGSVTSTSTAATGDQKQKAVARFDRPVTLQGVVLKGTYLFVHDDAAMNRGEACSYIYKGELAVKDKLVVSFHCTHVERTKAAHFVLRTVDTPSGMPELREFQFSGETASHAVPAPAPTGVVTLAVYQE